MEDLNDNTEWVFRDYMRFLNQSNDPIPPRDDVMEFDAQNNTKELENNIKLQGCPSDLQDKSKEVVTESWDVFCEGWIITAYTGIFIPDQHRQPSSYIM